VSARYSIFMSETTVYGLYHVWELDHSKGEAWCSQPLPVLQARALLRERADKHVFETRDDR